MSLIHIIMSGTTTDGFFYYQHILGIYLYMIVQRFPKCRFLPVWKFSSQRILFHRTMSNLWRSWGREFIGLNDCSHFLIAGIFHQTEQFYIWLIRPKGLHGLNLYVVSLFDEGEFFFKKKAPTEKEWELVGAVCF